MDPGPQTHENFTASKKKIVEWASDIFHLVNKIITFRQFQLSITKVDVFVNNSCSLETLLQYPCFFFPLIFVLWAFQYHIRKLTSTHIRLSNIILRTKANFYRVFQARKLFGCKFLNCRTTYSKVPVVLSLSPIQYEATDGLTFEKME